MANENYQAASGPPLSARRGEAVVYTGGAWTLSLPGTNGILVGVAGNITGQLIDDEEDVVYPVTAGVNPLRFRSITQAGTTATGLVALMG